jgi:lipopolysaccharide heptosyltransferase II
VTLIEKVSSTVNDSQSPGKILVIKICCLGDVIFLTPSLRALRDRFPAARISLLTSSWVRPIAEQIPFINDILIFDAPLNRKLNSKGISELLRVIWTIRKEKYDVAICGHRNNLFSWMTFFSRIPLRIGFSDKHSYLVTDPVFFHPDRHEIMRYGDLVNVLDARMSDIRTEIKPRETDLKHVDELFSKIGIQKDEYLVGIMAGGGKNPGTSMPIKRWGIDNYKELCNRILADPKKKIILLGASTDNEVNESILAGLSTFKKNIFNVAGNFPLDVLPALLKKLNIVIGGDTGPLHLAAAVGTQTIFLFGPSDPRLVAPISQNSVYLWKQVDCSPCYTPVTVMQKKSFHGDEFFCQTGTHDCLKKLTVDEVYNTFMNLVKRNSN